CGCEVDKEQHAIQVMQADKPLAVIDEMTIPDGVCEHSRWTSRGWRQHRFESRTALTQSSQFFDELLFGLRCVAHTALSALIPSRLQSYPRRNVRQKRSRRRQSEQSQTRPQPSVPPNRTRPPSSTR